MEEPAFFSIRLLCRIVEGVFERFVFALMVVEPLVQVVVRSSYVTNVDPSLFVFRAKRVCARANTADLIVDFLFFQRIGSEKS